MKLAFGVKSARVDTLAIQLNTDNAGQIRELLQHNIEKYLKFKTLPFILDVSNLNTHETLPLTDIMAMFAVYGLNIIGLRHQNHDWAKFAESNGLAFIHGSKSDLSDLSNATHANDVQAAQETTENTTPETEENDTLHNDNDAIKSVEMAKMGDLVEFDTHQNHEEDILLSNDETDENSEEKVSLMPAKPTIVVSTAVRTGQQVYAEHADLIVLGIVSPGAEVIADGNIHIYAPLRGRALAGASGDTKARIFVQSMQAELVSIAGIYRVFDQKLPEHLHKKAVQIELQDDRLAIGALYSE